MEISAKSNIIQFPINSADNQIKVEKLAKKISYRHNYRLILETDGNFSLSIDIPIGSICQVSDTAHYVVTRLLPDGFLEDRLEDLAQSYIKLYGNMGIHTKSYKLAEIE